MPSSLTSPNSPTPSAHMTHAALHCYAHSTTPSLATKYKGILEAAAESFFFSFDNRQRCTEHMNQQGNRIDYTSPALCTPVTPFPADPISAKRRNDPLCCMTLTYSRSNDPFCSERVIVHCQWGRKSHPGDRRCGLS